MNKKLKQPVVIAGPCSLESLDQLSAVAESLSHDGRIAMIRCGVWKPRTQPGGFEGVGDKGLHWIDEIKKRYPNIKFCCEVANAHHVEGVLKHSIDAVWIGARTTASPFAVQEVTEALRGCRLPVMVKNAPMPDLHIWIGSIERCRQVGLTDIAAIHRGFDIYNNLGYRNNPLWEIPMELHRLMPDLPLLCDPSHICGRRDLIAQVSQTALDLHFDGLMIEVHPSPANALTDSQQQFSPDQFEQMIDTLVVRTAENTNANDELRSLRSRIDNIDRQILSLLADRQAASREIAAVKQRDNMTIFQPQRWNTLLNDRMAQAQSLGLDPSFVKELYEKIHAESVRQQESMLSPHET